MKRVSMYLLALVLTTVLIYLFCLCLDSISHLARTFSWVYCIHLLAYSAVMWCVAILMAKFIEPL